MVDVHQLIGVFRRFAVTMTEPFEITNVLFQLGDAAVGVVGADGAGVSLGTADGRLEFVTTTDRSLIQLEQTQQDHQQGPCVEAFHSGQPITMANIAEEAPWEPYRQAAAASNFASVIGMPLLVGEHRLGSLNIYRRRPHEWSDDEVEAAAALAEIGTAYIVRAGQHANAVTLAGQLQHALDSRVVIEQAKGALSRDRQISVAAAFELLRGYARSHNQSLRDVAEAVVHEQLDIT